MEKSMEVVREYIISRQVPWTLIRKILEYNFGPVRHPSVLKQYLRNLSKYLIKKLS